MKVARKLPIGLAFIFVLIACSENRKSDLKLENRVSKPNVIILLADDLGYGDLGCYGSQSIETPNIDELASQGVRFTRFYSASAVCSPSRASLLTGKYPLRFDIRRHFTDNQEHLPKSSTTIAEVLKGEGYETAHIGKWHLGGLRPMDYEARSEGKVANPGPLQHGFDYSLTSIEGAPVRPELISQRRLYREGGKYMVRNDKKAPESDKHWTELKVDEAITLLDGYAERKNPFFLNIWFDVPHTPYEPAPEPHLSKYKALGVTGDQLLFRSMVSHLDANIGRLIKHLKNKGLFENTIILFASDNGPAFQGNPGPFRGGKTDLHEGGVRVPFIAVWKDHFPENTHSFNTIHMADLFPTVLDAVGMNIDMPNLDGKNKLEQLKNNTYSERDAIFWQMDLYKGFQNQGPKPQPYATSTIVEGKWKLVIDSLGPAALYDLNADHRELYNVLENEPELVKNLSDKLNAFLEAERDTSGFVQLH